MISFSSWYMTCDNDWPSRHSTLKTAFPRVESDIYICIDYIYYILYIYYLYIYKDSIDAFINNFVIRRGLSFQIPFDKLIRMFSLSPCSLTILPMLSRNVPCLNNFNRQSSELSIPVPIFMSIWTVWLQGRLVRVFMSFYHLLVTFVYILFLVLQYFLSSSP